MLRRSLVYDCSVHPDGDLTSSRLVTQDSGDFYLSWEARKELAQFNLTVSDRRRSSRMGAGFRYHFFSVH